MSPIRPENRHRYPPDWQAIRARILHRAGNCCEQCGLRNHAWGWRDTFGAFREVARQPLIEAGCHRPPFEVAAWSTPTEALPGRVLRIIEIVLTIAHLNHNPEDCRDENLRAWCQRCHNRYDLASRRAGIRERKHADQISFDFPKLAVPA